MKLRKTQWNAHADTVAGVLIIAEITVYSAIAYYLQTYRGKKSEMEVGKEWNVYADKVVGPYLNW